MTDPQTYTIKEMLEKMDERTREDRAQTNTKIDSLHTVLTEFRAESKEENEDQDKRILTLESWKSFIMGAFWVLSGIAAILFIVFEFVVQG